MYTKAKIFNLALGALLLTKRISDTDTDTSVENLTLNVHYDTAFRTTIEDLDLDSLSVQSTLELIEEDPNDLWLFAYKYPANCSLLRRIQSEVTKDTRNTQIQRRIITHNGVKAIFTNQEDAILEYIPHDLTLNLLSSNAGLAVAYKLAILAAPLISGKGAGPLRKEIQSLYLLAKTKAQEHDRLENASYDEDSIMSEFVEERLS